MYHHTDTILSAQTTNLKRKISNPPMFVIFVPVLLVLSWQVSFSEGSICSFNKRCVCTKNLTSAKADCSRRGLKAIPKFTSEVQWIDLSHNRIEKIDRLFPKKLVFLDLSWNLIDSIDNHSFQGLSYLKFLSLESNNIKLSTKNYHTDIFLSMVSMNVLNIQNNSINGTDFFDFVPFSSMPYLNKLRTDAPRKLSFGETFLKLKSFRELNISGKTGICSLETITNDDFSNLPYLETLDISGCKITEIERGSFGVLKQLRYLDISHNIELGFVSLPNVTYNLNNTSIQEFRFDRIHCLMGPGTILRFHHLINIQNTSIKCLSFANNRLEFLEDNVFSIMPKTLERISFQANKMTTGPYLLNLPLLKGLKIYDLSLQFSDGVPIAKKLQEKCDENTESTIDVSLSGIYTRGNNMLPENMELSVFNQSNEFMNSCDPSQYPFTFPSLPPKVEIIYWNKSQNIGIFQKSCFEAPNLKELYLQDNVWHQWIGPIKGLENVKYFDLSNNFCTYVSDKFFANLTGLTNLVLSKNSLSQSLQSDKEGNIFRNQKIVEVLDLSNNSLEYLPRHLLKNMFNLRTLILVNNKISKWNLRIKHMKNLHFIDLSQNKLNTISWKRIPEIDAMFRSNNLTIDISGNSILCSCENRKFLQWVSLQALHFRGITQNKCSDLSLKSFSFNDMRQSVSMLEKRCMSYFVYYIAGAVTMSIVLSAGICFIVYKNRWKIRYLRYMSKQKMRGYSSVHTSVGYVYEFDAYISYSEDDLSFVKNEIVPKVEETSSIRFAIKDRDFPLGSICADTTIEYIQRSKRLLCIISRKYLDAEWQDYELNMAKMDGIEARKNLQFIILILMPDVCTGIYPKKIKSFIKEGCYIEYPDDPMGYSVFWDELTQILSKPI